MVIWKQTLEKTKEQMIRVPATHNFLTAQMQDGQPTVWFECDPDTPLIDKKVYIAGTGWGVPLQKDAGEYIGTVQDGPLVWHVYA